MKKENFDNFLIESTKPVREAMKKINKNQRKIVFVVDNNDILVGTVSDGDIRRYLMKNKKIDGVSIIEICNRNPVSANSGMTDKEIKELMIEHSVNEIPILTKESKVVGIAIATEFSQSVRRILRDRPDVTTVIMAGGFGKRLQPFTNVFPKPMIPVGNKTIIEHIIDKLQEYNIDEFYVSLGYKHNIVRSYLKEVYRSKSPKIRYLIEKQPLGTAGSLTFLKEKIEKDILVVNCDTFFDFDFYDLIGYHKNSGNDITIVVSNSIYKIPYGVCEIKDGKLIRILEKPELKNLVYTGMYVLKPQVLNLIPKDTTFHATELFEFAILKNKKGGIYQIREDSWMDIGQWEEYAKVIRMISIDNLISKEGKL